MDMNVVLAELRKPFPIEKLKWRIGNKNKDKTKANMLVYIDARDVEDRLDEVCGANWSDDVKEVAGRIVCTITINGISRTDGAGDTDFEGEKGGLSDAFKRAGVKWGIGRYLYNASKYNTWVNCKDVADYDLYNKNKEQLDKVANAISNKVNVSTPAPKQPSLEERINAFKDYVSKADIKQLNEEKFEKKFEALCSQLPENEKLELRAFVDNRQFELLENVNG